jgi:hypothetical protein
MHTVSYSRHRFPAEVIQHAVWLYFRFPLSFRDVEDLLAQRGIDVSYETDGVDAPRSHLCGRMAVLKTAYRGGVHERS